MKSRKPISVIVHYPTTEEGWEKLKKSQAMVMSDILENKLGEKKVKELFDYMKTKTVK